MTDPFSSRLTALEETWRLWAAVGTNLTDAQWRTPTRCTGWDVAAVYAHHSAFPQAVDAPLPTTDTPGDPITAVTLLRGFNAPNGVAHALAETIADREVQEAATRTRAELVGRFATHGPSAITHLSAGRPDLIISWAGAAVLPLVEVLRVLLMEATVHLLDVLRALNLPPVLPPAATTDTALLLAEMAPPVDFIESATGRSATSPLPVLR
jgi:uncharacterized protein (TIGR03083 family)